MKSKIKVAFFADILEREVDGAVRTMYQLIDRIPNESFEYLFFSGMPPKTELNHKLVRVPAVTLPFNTTYQASVPQVKGISITKSLMDFSPDVIHISTPSTLGFFALNYAKRNNIPVLSIYHTHYISYIQYYLKNFPLLTRLGVSFAKKQYRSFYNQCDVIYTPTNQMINELSNVGISNKFMKLWQRGLDTRLFNPTKKDADFIKKITGNNKPNIVFASRLVWEKNLETLFKIYDEIEAQKLDANFIVAGNGSVEEIARKRMKKAVFLGHIDHETLAKVYASSEIFVFPSVSETYGNVVVEAMASGCIPVIARGGGSQSLVQDGKTGFLCEPNDATLYVENIKKILCQSELKAKMQREGLGYTAKLSWENLAKEYFNDVEYLSQFKPVKSNVFTLRNIFPANSPSRKLATNFN